VVILKILLMKPSTPEQYTMKTIYKYTLKMTDSQTISMPIGAKILSVQNQNHTVTLWAEVEDALPTEDRIFFVVGTGMPIPSNPLNYIGTVQTYAFVWHIFEVITNS
jgi:hypothetical protein